MTPLLTVIIPVWNLQDRGLDRVKWSIYTLTHQTIPVEVVVFDASTKKTAYNFNGDKVRHIRKPHPQLCIPHMMNRGIELANTEYIATTGADFLFKPDFCAKALMHGIPGQAVFCEVDEMIRSMRLSESFLDQWEFVRVAGMLKRNLGPVNNSGRTHAPGAINLMHRDDWIKSGGYNEKFKKWGGYDNEFCSHLHNIGIKAKWIQKVTQCIHQYHKIEKQRLGRDKKEWDLNQQMYNETKNQGREKDANWLKMGELV